MHRRANKLFAVILFLLIAILLYLTPFSGDDLSYMGCFTGEHSYLSWDQYHRFLAGHWFGVNGRMANLVMPPVALLPKWITAALFSAMTVAMFALTAKAASPRRMPHMFAVATLLCLIVLPWWDSMCIFDCLLNYVWTSALVLAALLVITRERAPRWPVAAWLLCGVAGAMHEGASLPLTVGLLLYMIVSHRDPDRVKIRAVYLWPFIAGTLFVSLSPGIVLRAGGERIADDPLFPLMLKSTLLPAALIVALTIVSLSRAGRPKVARLLRSPMLILLTASVLSMVIGLWSGIVGRSGWFAQLFALIVALRVVSGRYPWLFNHITATVATLLSLAYYLTLDIYQSRLNDEYARFLDDYTKSPRGVVFIDYTRDPGLPYWILGRTRGVPDPDDVHLLNQIALYYRSDAQWPVVLPAEAEAHLPLGERTVRLTNGDLLTPELPEGTLSTLMPREGLTVPIADVDGKPMVAQPLPGGGYHLSLRQVDPGDR
ncbi:MAG: DUF6056 family protein [Muribaculaceae bacterium]|nr:DUF6056 family protein [Muribaculaceae bacterium]